MSKLKYREVKLLTEGHMGKRLAELVKLYARVEDTCHSFYYILLVVPAL